MLAARRLSPITCREQAVARFSSLRMTARYLRVYEHLTTQPRGTFQSNAEWVV
jgi:hypothetical protein